MCLASGRFAGESGLQWLEALGPGRQRRERDTVPKQAPARRLYAEFSVEHALPCDCLGHLSRAGCGGLLFPKGEEGGRDGHGGNSTCQACASALAIQFAVVSSGALDA